MSKSAGVGQVLGRGPMGPGPWDAVMSAATPPRLPSYVMAFLGLLGQGPVALQRRQDLGVGGVCTDKPDTRMGGAILECLG